VSLLELSAHTLLDRFASTDPTPGGGSAAALAGAVGAALVSMVCAMEKTRTGDPSERERLDRAGALVREVGRGLRTLVDVDAAAYEAVMAAYRLPKGTDEEKGRRKEAIAAAMAHATDVPRRTAHGCLAILRAAVDAATHGNPNALSDARAGGALAWAGLMGAVENVRINLGPQADPAAVAEIDGLLRDARGLAIALGLTAT
jgi:methenyltetrahydrofolate cyclohydrolase